MTNDDITRNIWRNTISNYGFVVLRMGLGLIMFRLLYQGLGREEFGFWALLWSVFGFGILLDFGFGFTAVKRVAELSVHGDWERLSRVLSTIIYLYVVIGILIVLPVLFGSHFIIGLFQITPENREMFREVLVYFFIGMGITFPLGIFPEILVGQQRICLTNIIFAIGLVGNFVFLLIALHFQWELKYIVMIGLLSGIVPNIIAAFFALRGLPHVRIRPGLFSFKMIRETLGFSIFAYISTVSNMILAKTDQLILSTTLAVSSIAIYQAGAKVGEMFGALTHQLPDTFSPAAAHLHAKGDRQFLRKLLINGTRFSVMIATPAYFICAFYMEGILRLITGETVPGRETYWVGQVLLLWGYSSLVTQGVCKRIFMMSGHERRLTGLSVGEAVLNLALSVGFVLHFRNVLGVAFGSLVSSIIFGWFYIWPWAAREANLTGWQLARTVLFPIWLACLPLLGFVLLGRAVPWLAHGTSAWLLLAQCTVALAIGLAGLWVRALTCEERSVLLLKFNHLVSRRPAT